MDGIQISIARLDSNPDISIVKINGYIDTTTSGELERVIQNLLREQRYKIIIDLSGVDYISSAGWGIFISEIKNLRSHKGDLKLANMSENVTEVYELLEFSTILSSAASVADAARLFDGVAGAEAGAKKAAPAPGAPRPAAAAPAPPRPASGPQSAPAAPRPAPAAPRPAPQPAPQPAARPAAVPQPASPAAAAPRPAPAPQPVASAPAAPVPPAPANPAEAALIDRIRSVVRIHPDWGAWKIKGELNRQRGAHAKVSWGEVRAELKFNGLKKKADRFRFAQNRQ